MTFDEFLEKVSELSDQFESESGQIFGVYIETMKPNVVYEFDGEKMSPRSGSIEIGEPR